MRIVWSLLLLVLLLTGCGEPAVHWKEIQVFHGKGSAVLNRLGLRVSGIWAVRLSCRGEGHVTAMLYPLDVGGSFKCGQTRSAFKVQEREGTLHQLELVTDPAEQWQVQLFVCTGTLASCRQYPPETHAKGTPYQFVRANGIIDNNRATYSYERAEISCKEIWRVF
ncbi:hypothetical protein EI42_05174 [Thermosporothrix hazakensis]|jgi:hypothetical protein|uniref:Lipoprotein n=1 Tax=Thermosporothrix hazakensis TaxID=644383 RepID=A0A326TZP3_THEHA|nr:hypothetical protein [Thermosporothrix hazakensis]PZW22962.1 hypothetical protein EI42_05174 [Thermosporothrix hazakensis]GCE48275.1 hypothetical protein KTH_31440 [Thermosporothrix hazakensis]